MISDVPTGPIPGTHSPSKITDLVAEIKGQMVELLWTATGDDLDSGNGKNSLYELLFAFKYIDFCFNFGTV